MTNAPTNDPHRDQPVLHAGPDLVDARAVTILLHGRGATAEGILGLAGAFGVDGVAYLAPQAATSQWYPRRFLEPVEANEPWLTSALAKVGAVVDQARDAGFRRSHIVIGGFSQGACLATEYLGRNAHRWGGGFAFSGGLIGAELDPATYGDDLDGTPIFSDRQNVPALADLDCDGDLDLFIATLGGHLVYYEHVGVEDGVPQYRLVSDTYQDLDIVGDVGPTKTLHGANAITFADADEDGDQDLIWGDFFSASLYFIANTGTCAAPALTLRANRYPETNPVSTSGYNVPRFADIDADGDLDLFVGVLGGAYGAATDVAENFLFYERTGETFTLRTRQYLSQIDVGDESIPAFADLDADGDRDLVVGTRIDPAVPRRAALVLFENTGTPEAPRYRRTTPALADLGDRFNAAPTFGDLDGDGDPDLLIGTFDGLVRWYRNQGTPEAPDFVQEGAVADLPRGSLAVPALADLDADGDLDLVVGGSTGAVAYFRNTGTPEAPAFTLAEEALADIDVGVRSMPALTDLDADGDLDLVVGSERSGVRVYRNEGTPATPDFVLATDALVPSPVPPAFAPAVADLDGDGTPALVAGTLGGGLHYYASEDVADATEASPRSSGALRLTNHPNPFSGRTTLRFTLDRPDGVRVVVHDLLGRQVRMLLDDALPAGEHAVPFAPNGLPSGTYVCLLTTSDGRRVSRVVTYLR